MEKTITGKKWKQSGRRIGFLLYALIPAFLLYIIFNVVPTFEIFVGSLYDGTMIGDKLWVGPQNFIEMFKLEIFWKAFGNTMYLLVLPSVLTIFFALLFAYVLSKSKIKGKKFFRFVFYIPNILSIVVIAAVFLNIYADKGLLNAMLQAIGLGDLARMWMSDDKTVLNAVMFVMIWQAVGYYMIMYIAGMDGIDPAVYESASIDGAKGPTKFFRITLPLTWNIIRTTFSLYIIGSINLGFLLINAMLGTEAMGNDVLLNIMYFESSVNYGYSMAIGTFMFVVTFVLSFVVEKLSSRDFTD